MPCDMMLIPCNMRYKKANKINMKFTPELIKGSTKNLILAVLTDEDMYGYQIVKAIREQSEDALEFGEGSVYPALHALEHDAYVRGYWIEHADARDRKYYSLTKKGRRALKDAMQEWKEFSHAVNKIFRGVERFSSF